MNESQNESRIRIFRVYQIEYMWNNLIRFLLYAIYRLFSRKFGKKIAYSQSNAVMLCMSAYGVIMNVCFAAVLLIAFAQHACYLLWQTSPCGPRNRAGECSYPLPARGIHATQQQFSLRIPAQSSREGLSSPTRRAGCVLHSSNFLYASLRNRVGKVYLPLLAARGVCCIAAIFFTHPYAIE